MSTYLLFIEIAVGYLLAGVSVYLAAKRWILQPHEHLIVEKMKGFTASGLLDGRKIDLEFAYKMILLFHLALWPVMAFWMLQAMAKHVWSGGSRD